MPVETSALNYLYLIDIIGVRAAKKRGYLTEGMFKTWEKDTAIPMLQAKGYYLNEPEFHDLGLDTPYPTNRGILVTMANKQYIVRY